MAKMMFKYNKEDYKTPTFDKSSLLQKKDSRMRFNNSKDPIYHVFELLEKRSVVDLVEDMIKDSYFEISQFVSKVVK